MRELNGNGNGYHSDGAGSLTQRKLETVLAYHEGVAEAIRTTLGVLANGAAARKQARAPHVFEQAVSVDRARVEKVDKPQKSNWTADREAMRRKSARFLELFSTTTPQHPRKMPLPAGMKLRGLGSLVRRGYLVRRAGGYVRTAKEYVV